MFYESTLSLTDLCDTRLKLTIHYMNYNSQGLILLIETNEGGLHRVHLLLRTGVELCAVNKIRIPDILEFRDDFIPSNR
jgi:hypothetical protein